MNYRRDIDGLRALAVLPVILFHAGFQAFSGGFIGVDIFFVISGYLITTIIISDLHQNKFSILNFYERRARRILPALFFVMLLTVPFAWAVLTPFDLVSFAKSLVAVPLFSSNFFFWKDGAYFETAAELKPLIHTWSLAVEEQYYLFFPVFLIFSWKLGQKWVIRLIIFFALVSLFIAQLYAVSKPTSNFFLLPSRIWELGMGSLIAFYPSSNYKKITENPILQQYLSALGFLMILTSIFLFNKNTPTPSFYILIPNIGAALILLFSKPTTLVGKILGSRLSVAIGLISYSAYLWHQPILALSKYHFSITDGITKLLLVLITLLLATLSWKYIEQPFRNKSKVSNKSIVIFSIIGSLFFIIIGSLTAKIFNPTYNFEYERKLAKTLSKSTAVFVSNMDERKFIKYRIQYETLSPENIIIGSSRVIQFRAWNSSTLNFGVSGASIEDFVAISDLATKKFKSNTIYIGLDPWLFNLNSEQNRWLSLKNEYLEAINTLKNSDSKVSQPLSDQDNESLLTNLGLSIYDFISIQKTEVDNAIPEEKDKILNDGSRVYNVFYSAKTQSEISNGFNDLINYSMTNYNSSKEYKDLLETLLRSYSGNYNVVLILSPYHPKLYERMKQERQIFLDLENEYIALANKLGLKILGSYDPAKVGCSIDEFYDGMHPKEACMKKIIATSK